MHDQRGSGFESLGSHRSHHGPHVEAGVAQQLGDLVRLLPVPSRTTGLLRVLIGGRRGLTRGGLYFRKVLGADEVSAPSPLELLN